MDNTEAAQNIPTAWAWLLDLPEDEVRAAVSDSVQEIIEVIGLESAVALLARYEGQQIYLQKLDRAFRHLRDDRIRAEFTGANHTELARRYGLSTNRIREILQPQLYQQECLFP